MSEQNWTKIIIPSGTMDPSQTAIIEIPVNLKGSHVIIAKNKTGANGQDDNGSPQNGDEGELDIMSGKEKEMLESILNYEEERERLVVAPVRKKYRLVDQMEYVETGVIRKDISDFQQARRKLVFDVHGIISTLPDINKDISSSLQSWVDILSNLAQPNEIRRRISHIFLVVVGDTVPLFVYNDSDQQKMKYLRKNEKVHKLESFIISTYPQV